MPTVVISRKVKDGTHQITRKDSFASSQQEREFIEEWRLPEEFAGNLDRDINTGTFETLQAARDELRKEGGRRIDERQNRDEVELTTAS